MPVEGGRVVCGGISPVDHRTASIFSLKKLRRSCAEGASLVGLPPLPTPRMVARAFWMMPIGQRVSGSSMCVPFGGRLFGVLLSLGA